jgi:hypothetical protein
VVILSLLPWAGSSLLLLSSKLISLLPWASWGSIKFEGANSKMQYHMLHKLSSSTTRAPTLPFWPHCLLRLPWLILIDDWMRLHEAIPGSHDESKRQYVNGIWTVLCDCWGYHPVCLPRNTMYSRDSETSVRKDINYNIATH